MKSLSTVGFSFPKGRDSRPRLACKSGGGTAARRALGSSGLQPLGKGVGLEVRRAGCCSAKLSSQVASTGAVIDHLSAIKFETELRSLDAGHTRR